MAAMIDTTATMSARIGHPIKLSIPSYDIAEPKMSASAAAKSTAPPAKKWCTVRAKRDDDVRAVLGETASAPLTARRRARALRRLQALGVVSAPARS